MRLFRILLILALLSLGSAAFLGMPLSDFRSSLAYPQLVVDAKYPGASAQTISEMVANPIEEELNGMKDMLYMTSQSTSSGIFTLNIFFDPKTDIAIAEANAQARIDQLLPSLPLEVQQQGIKVHKQSTSPFMFIAIEVEMGRYDDLYTRNFAHTYVMHRLMRINGISDVKIIGDRVYAMRIWLRPDLMAQYGISTTEVVSAIQGQNSQYAIGQIGQIPTSKVVELNIPLVGGERLNTPEAFENIILRATDEGTTVTIKDIGRAELGAENYEVIGEMNGKSSTTLIALYLEQGFNPFEISQLVQDKIQEIESETLPVGLSFSIPFDATRSPHKAQRSVQTALIQILLLAVIALFFYGRLTAAAFLVSIVALGLFFLYLFQGSFNSISSMAFISAILLFVPLLLFESRESAKLILASLFITSILLLFLHDSWISFYKEWFFLTFLLLLCTPFLLPKSTFITNSHLPSFAHLILAVLLLVVTYFIDRSLPHLFLPRTYQGYFLASAQLPDGASLYRTYDVTKKMERLTLKEKGVTQFLSFTGFNLLENVTSPQTASYIILSDDPSLFSTLSSSYNGLNEAVIHTYSSSPLYQLSLGEEVHFWIKGLKNVQSSSLQEYTDVLFNKFKEEKEIAFVESSLHPNNLQLQVSLDRIRTKSKKISDREIYHTIQCQFGSLYVSNFEKDGQFFQVILQAEPEYRDSLSDIAELFVQSENKVMVPLKSLITLSMTKGDSLITHYNGFLAAKLKIVPKPGISLNQVRERVEEGLNGEEAPFKYYWSQIVEINHRTLAQLFLLSLLLLFLLCSAYFESFKKSLFLFLFIPVGLFGAYLALFLFRLPVDLYFQGALFLIPLFSILWGLHHQKAKESIQISIVTLILLLPLLFTSLGRSMGTGLFGAIVALTLFSLIGKPKGSTR